MSVYVFHVFASSVCVCVCVCVWMFYAAIRIFFRWIKLIIRFSKEFTVILNKLQNELYTVMKVIKHADRLLLFSRVATSAADFCPHNRGGGQQNWRLSPTVADSTLTSDESTKLRRCESGISVSQIGPPTVKASLRHCRPRGDAIGLYTRKLPDGATLLQIYCTYVGLVMHDGVENALRVFIYNGDVSRFKLSSHRGRF